MRAPSLVLLHSLKSNTIQNLTLFGVCTIHNIKFYVTYLVLIWKRMFELTKTEPIQIHTDIMNASNQSHIRIRTHCSLSLSLCTSISIGVEIWHQIDIIYGGVHNINKSWIGPIWPHLPLGISILFGKCSFFPRMSRNKPIANVGTHVHVLKMISYSPNKIIST